MKHEVEKLIVQILSKMVVLCNIKTTFLYSDFNKVVVVAIDLMMMTTMMTMRAGGKEMDCYFHAVEPCAAQRTSIGAHCSDNTDIVKLAKRTIMLLNINSPSPPRCAHWPGAVTSQTLLLRVIHCYRERHYM